MTTDNNKAYASNDDEVYVFAASVAQNRFWSLDQLQPGNPSLNLAFAINIQGVLDTDTLQRSVDEIVRRHEALRTTFSVQDGRLMQVVAQSSSVCVRVVTLAVVPEVDREAQSLAMRMDEAQLPFSLTDGPLFRVTLAHFGDSQHLLLLSLHHIICDGWSSGIIVRELGAVYSAYSGGLESPLQELAVQYADFAAWQQDWLMSEGLEQQGAYWAQQFGNGLPVLDLPTDRLLRVPNCCPGDTQTLLLADELVSSLRDLCMSEGVTMFMLLLAVYCTLLYRYTSNEDILVGSPAANRQTVELEEVVGLFSNPMLLRTDFSGTPTFRQLLGRVREVVLGAFANQDIPFEKVVENLPLDFERSHGPLLQAYFIFQKAFLQPVELPDSEWKPLRSVTPGAIFDLTLSCLERFEGIRLQLEYRTDIFDSTTIIRMLEHYSILLESVIGDPNRRISELPILTFTEHRALMSPTDPETSPTTISNRIHELIEANAVRSPNAVAVEYCEATLTYFELNLRSDQLADRLRLLGAGPGVLIGIFLNPSLLSVVAMLGVLKSGAAFVAFDPQYPRQRLEEIAKNVSVSLLLKLADSDCDLPIAAATVVSLDSASMLPLIDDEIPFGGDLADEDWACVVFSEGVGSSVNPVVLRHRALTRHATDIARAFGLCKSDRVVQFASMSSSSYLDELLPALIAGSTVVLMPTDRMDPQTAVLQDIGSKRCTVLNLPSGFLTALVYQANDHLVSGLETVRLIITGGDRVPAKVQEFLSSKCSHVRLLQTYSTAETGGAAAIKEIADSSTYKVLHESSCIGRPIGDTRLYVLDRGHQLVPAGVIGELYIGGDSLGAGYLNGSEERGLPLVSDPVRSGMQVFRTGDVARYSATGDIQCLGRVDQHVEAFGCRIDCRAIELTIEQHPGVAIAMVVSIVDMTGLRRLVAFVVGNPDSSKPDDLRDHVRQTLPYFMVPDAFVHLDAVPLTPNGKIDRSVLYAMEYRLDKSRGDDVAPRDNVERTLIRIWESLLHARNISTRDNFFELGGHSLLAVRLFHEIENTFGRSLPLGVLFESPTIESLADILRPQSAPLSWPALVPIQPNGTKPPLFCMHRDDGLVMCYRDLAQCLGPDQPVYGLQAHGLNAEVSVLPSVEMMAEQYAREICSFYPEGPYLLAGSSFGGILAFEVARQLQAEGRTVALLALFDTFAPIALRDRLHEKPALQRAQVHVNVIKRMNLKGKLQYIATKVKKRVEGSLHTNDFNIDGDIGDHLPDALVRLQQANLMAYREYEPGPYSGKIMLFRAAERNYFANYNPTLWWDSVPGMDTRNDFDIFDLPSNHLHIMKLPHVYFLAEKLTALIEHALPDRYMQERK